MIGSKTARWLGFVGLAALVIAAGAMHWKAREAKELASPNRARRAGQPIPVRTALVSQSPKVDVVGATSTTAPSATAIIQLGASRNFLETDLVVTAVHAVEGKKVAKGEVLFELDSRVFAGVLAERQETLKAAQSELERAEKSVELDRKVRELEVSSASAEVTFRQADLKRRKDNLDHYDRLYKGNSANIIEYGEALALHADAIYRLADAERRLQRANDALSVGMLQDAENVASARAKAAAAKFEVNIAQRDLERCRVVSPIEGYADAVGVTPGGTVAVGAALTQVHALDPIHVRVDFPQERIEDAAIGQVAEVVLDSAPRTVEQGRVIRVGAVAAADTRVIPVVVELSNPSGRIRAGVSGYARIHLNRSAPAVPQTAVMTHGTSSMVFRVEHGAARMRAVEVGPAVGDGMLEVRGGLDIGDEVVVYGQQTLRDADPVKTEWRQWARRGP